MRQGHKAGSSINITKYIDVHHSISKNSALPYIATIISDSTLHILLLNLSYLSAFKKDFYDSYKIQLIKTSNAQYFQTNLLMA